MLSDTFSEIVGIIGGIGPEASNYFVSLLIKIQKGTIKKDQDHIPFLMFNNPQIPDRSKHLVYGKQNPLPEFIKTGQVLKNAGATFLAMPCNTSHAYIQEIEKAVGVKVLNMVEITAKFVIKTFGKKAVIGILATDGTIKSMLYQKEFSKISTEATVIIPDDKGQKNVMEAIYDIKAFSVNSANTQALYQEAEILMERGATLIILGCTEIPLALPKHKRVFPMVDPMEILAKEVVLKTLISKVTKKYPLPTPVTGLQSLEI